MQDLSRQSIKLSLKLRHAQEYGSIQDEALLRALDRMCYGRYAPYMDPDG